MSQNETHPELPQQYMKNHGDKWAADFGIVSHRNYIPETDSSTRVIDIFPVFRQFNISNSYNYK